MLIMYAVEIEATETQDSYVAETFHERLNASIYLEQSGKKGRVVRLVEQSTTHNLTPSKADLGST